MILASVHLAVSPSFSLRLARGHFPFPRVHAASEVILGMGNHPLLALSLAGLFMPYSSPNHVAVLTCVCGSVLLLAATSPPTPCLYRIFPIPRGTLHHCSRRDFLPLPRSVPLPPLPFRPRHKSFVPSPTAVVRKRPIPLYLGSLPWPTNVHDEALYISFSWNSVAGSRSFLSSTTSPAVIDRSDNP